MLPQLHDTAHSMCSRLALLSVAMQKCSYQILFLKDSCGAHARVKMMLFCYRFLAMFHDVATSGCDSTVGSNFS